MSIYATNYIVDENSGEPTLLKHLNKHRVHRFTCKSRVGKWNKSGHACHVKREGGLSHSILKEQRQKIQISKIKN